MSRVEKARLRAAVDATRRNVWLGAGTPVDQAYPCRCPEDRPCDGRPDPDRPGVFWCPCHGRRTRRSHRCCGGPARP